MQEPIEAYCHVGIVHPMAFPEVAGGEGPILETLRTVAEDPFFSAVEVTWMKDAATRAEAARMMSTAGLDVVFLAQTPLLQQKLSLCDLDEAARRKAVDFCKGLIDQAYELGASILGVSSGPDPGEAKREAAMEALVDSLKQLCDDAQQKTQERMLSIALESFDRDVDKRALIGPTSAAVEVAAAVYAQYSNFGLTIDLSHQPLLHESMHDMVLTAVDHLIHVHIGNCVIGDTGSEAYGDRHPRFGYPGSAMSVEELKRFLEALVYAGYFKRSAPTTMPVVSFEVRPMSGEDSGLVIANAKRTLRQAWARL